MSSRYTYSFNERFRNYGKPVYLKYIIANCTSDAGVYELIFIALLKPAMNCHNKYNDELTIKFDMPEFCDPVLCNMPKGRVN